MVCSIFFGIFKGRTKGSLAFSTVPQGLLTIALELMQAISLKNQSPFRTQLEEELGDLIERMDGFAELTMGGDLK